jgi:hypothetical protein
MCFEIIITLWKLQIIIPVIKCSPVQALRLCTGRAAHRGCRGIALLFLDHGSRRGWGVIVTPWPLFTPGKDPVPILQEAGWAPGPVWTGRKSRPHRDSIPDRPARSQSLYRLSYPAHNTNKLRVSLFTIIFLNNSHISMQIVYMCYIRIGMPTFTAYNANLNTDFMFKLNCTYPVCLTRANCTYGNILLQSSFLL